MDSDLAIGGKCQHLLVADIEIYTVYTQEVCSTLLRIRNSPLQGFEVPSLVFSRHSHPAAGPDESSNHPKKTCERSRQGRISFLKCKGGSPQRSEKSKLDHS